jgi:8-oxo-dGTP diphosphatase
LFKTDKFEGTLTSSDEGEIRWIDRDPLKECALVNDFMDLLKVFDSDCYNEFMYERNNGRIMFNNKSYKLQLFIILINRNL